MGSGCSQAGCLSIYFSALSPHFPTQYEGASMWDPTGTHQPRPMLPSDWQEPGLGWRVGQAGAVPGAQTYRPLLAGDSAHVH